MHENPLLAKTCKSEFATNFVWYSIGGSFVCVELKSINEKYIAELIKAKTDKEVLEIFNIVFSDGFVSYRIKELPFDTLLHEFKSLSIQEKKDFEKEILNKNLLYLLLSEIEDKDFKIDNNTKALNQIFYHNVSSR